MAVTSRPRRAAPVLGAAVCHARILGSRALPDALRMSYAENILRIDVPEGDFRVSLDLTDTGGTRLGFQATFRENRPAGGTWWSSWEINVQAPPDTSVVGTVLVSEIAAGRRRFARALADTRRLRGDPYRTSAGMSAAEVSEHGTS